MLAAWCSEVEAICCDDETETVCHLFAVEFHRRPCRGIQPLSFPDVISLDGQSARISLALVRLCWGVLASSTVLLSVG